MASPEWKNLWAFDLGRLGKMLGIIRLLINPDWNLELAGGNFESVVIMTSPPERHERKRLTWDQHWCNGYHMTSSWSQSKNGLSSWKSSTFIPFAKTCPQHSLCCVDNALGFCEPRSVFIREEFHFSLCLAKFQSLFFILLALPDIIFYPLCINQLWYVYKNKHSICLICTHIYIVYFLLDNNYILSIYYACNAVIMVFACCLIIVAKFF